MSKPAPPGEGPLETAFSLPPRWFTDPAVFELEKERIFARDWLCVARAEEVERPGDYKAFDLYDAPIIVVRGRDGEIRALSNVCRHRSMRIVEGRGNTSLFTCPYHRWAYDLDGTHRGAPLMEKSKGFDASRSTRS